MPRMPVPRQAHARPSANEYAPYYHAYVSLITTDDILGALESQRLQTSQLLAARSEREGNFRYAPGKWSVKEVVGHIADAERIFSYRALRIARGDATPLAGFEQDDYIRGGNFGERNLADLVEEFLAIRAASLALFRSLNDEAWSRRGVASNKEVTARAMAYIVAGHELHHRNILIERYFPAIPRA
jgi:DinB family protein